jgi:hypothetical protein
LNIFIAHTNYPVKDKRLLFIMTRPFYADGKWVDDVKEKERRGVNAADFHLVDAIDSAEIVLIPFSINYYAAEKKIADLASLNELCRQKNLTAYGYVFDDFGIALPEFSNFVYLRMSGFRSQLSDRNKGLPVAISDQFQRIFKKEEIIPNPKLNIPAISFCGHASFSLTKKIKEKLIFGRENLKRFFQNPLRKDWEPYFASAFERAKLMKTLEENPLVKTNFIYRNQYRAGAKSAEDLEKTTVEYYENILNSDYVLCLRGAGNFSVRLYETLMMGRIPIFVNTDCILPFEDKINWKNHVVWVEWKDRKNIATIVSDFHKKITNEDFINLQINNRKLWKETLSLNNMLQFLNK